MSKLQPGRRVPFTRGVKIALAFLAIVGIASGVFEYISLQSTDPDTPSPLSWAWWWMYESTGAWFAVFWAGVGGAFFSHLLWYRRRDDFWAPMTWTSALIIAVGTTISLLIVQAWTMLFFVAALGGAAVAAHRWWYRLELFDEHLERFHDE